MKVRSATVLDLGKIEDMHRETGALFSSQPPSVRLWSLVSLALSALLPLAQDTLLYVAEEGGRLVGFAQATGSGPALGLQPDATTLQVLNLNVAEDADPDEVLRELLEHLANRALGRGAVRLTVRVPLDDPMLRTIRMQGFRQYATENVLYAEDPQRVRDVVPAGLRPARRKDDRVLYQLYRKVTPQGVSNVEAPTFREWKQLHEEPGEHYVVDRVELVAWMSIDRSSESSRPHTLRFMALPESGLAEDIADHVLSVTGGGPAWSSLRHYDANMIDALRGRGFANLLTQALLVKELAVREPLREKGLVPSFG
ncbi:MAG: hypothetical protein ABI838_07340 [Chloroflexota bacterium]